MTPPDEDVFLVSMGGCMKKVPLYMAVIPGN